MDSLRGRLRRRAALRRALPSEEVDAEAVRRRWLSLNEEARMDALRFDDPAVVQAMHGHMSGLCRAELWSRRNLMGGLVRSDGGRDGDSERLTGFAFERPAETDCIGRAQDPISFIAVPELAARDDLIEEVERRLGGPLLSGRPALHRQDWATVAEETPGSWADLQRIAYRLVELAIFQAHQDAPPDVEDTVPVQTSHAEQLKTEEELLDFLGDGLRPDLAPGEQSARARKRAAKKARQASRAQEVQELGEEPEPAAPRPAGEEPAARDAEGRKGPLRSLSRTTSSITPKQDCRLRVTKREPWSSWMWQMAQDDIAEWWWMVFQPPEDQDHVVGPGDEKPVGVRAVVRNTFLDLEHDTKPELMRRSCYF